MATGIKTMGIRAQSLKAPTALSSLMNHRARNSAQANSKIADVTAARRSASRQTLTTAAAARGSPSDRYFVTNLVEVSHTLELNSCWITSVIARINARLPKTAGPRFLASKIPCPNPIPSTRTFAPKSHPACRVSLRNT